MTRLGFHWGEYMSELLAEINLRLPDNPTGEDLDRVLTEVEQEQRERHARERAKIIEGAG